MNEMTRGQGLELKFTSSISHKLLLIGRDLNNLSNLPDEYLFKLTRGGSLALTSALFSTSY